MKKTVLAVALISTPLLLTGCAKKQTLTCSQSLLGMMDYEIKLDYKGDKPAGGKMTISMDYKKMGASDDEVKKAKEKKLCDEIKGGSSDIEKYSSKCTEKWDGTSVTITLSLNKEFGKDEGYKTIKDAQETLEKGNFQCEVK